MRRAETERQCANTESRPVSSHRASCAVNEGFSRARNGRHEFGLGAATFSILWLLISFLAAPVPSGTGIEKVAAARLHAP